MDRNARLAAVWGGDFMLSMFDGLPGPMALELRERAGDGVLDRASRAAGRVFVASLPEPFLVGFEGALPILEAALKLRAADVARRMAAPSPAVERVMELARDGAFDSPEAMVKAGLEAMLEDRLEDDLEDDLEVDLEVDLEQLDVKGEDAARAVSLLEMTEGAAFTGLQVWPYLGSPADPGAAWGPPRKATAAGARARRLSCDLFWRVAPRNPLEYRPAGA